MTSAWGNWRRRMNTGSKFNQEDDMMARTPTRPTKDEDDDTDVMTKAIRTRAKDEDKDEDEAVKAKAGVEPFLASDVAPGFTAGPIPGAGSISAIKVDTATYGTETPPRQTPPTSIENFMKHSPPSFHDSNGAKIVSVAPTLSGISPSTAVAVTGADLTVTGTGTNFDRATFLTAGGAILTNTQYVSATSLTAVIRPALNVPGVVQVTAKNPGGESVQRAFTFT
jgi:hypothetical protein